MGFLWWGNGCSLRELHMLQMHHTQEQWLTRDTHTPPVPVPHMLANTTDQNYASPGFMSRWMIPCAREGGMGGEDTSVQVCEWGSTGTGHRPHTARSGKGHFESMTWLGQGGQGCGVTISGQGGGTERGRVHGSNTRQHSCTYRL